MKNFLLLSNNTPKYINFDFTTMANGALPGFISPTWQILNREAINYPIQENEYFLDPSLEANYTSGLCDSLIKSGTPTLAQSSDVHSGSKAQSFIATAQNNGVRYATAGTIGEYYESSLWAKRSSGTSTGTIMRTYDGINNVSGKSITGSSYTQLFSQVIMGATGGYVGINEGASSNFNTILLDDFSYKKFLKSSLFARRNFYSNLFVSSKITLDENNSLSGIFCRMNNNMTSYIGVFINNGSRIYVFKVLENVPALILNSAIAYSENSLLSITATNSSVSIYYGGIQIGTTQSVTDVGIVNNKFCGLFSTGNTQFSSFTCQAM